MAEINTVDLIVDFGRYRGVRWTRVPVYYLIWIANEKDHKAGPIARAELKRRGTITPEVQISGHAIDRASQNLLGKWMETRRNDEGLYAWLARMASDSVKFGRQRGTAYEYVYVGMVFIFGDGDLCPTLITVMRD